MILPKPKSKQTNYLNYSFLYVLINLFKTISFNHQKKVFIFYISLILFSLYGFSKIKAVSFLIDDVPAESSLMKDMKFFESNFSGVMPLEIIIDTKNKKGVQNLNTLKKIDRLENFLKEKIQLLKKML